MVLSKMLSLLALGLFLPLTSVVVANAAEPGTITLISRKVDVGKRVQRRAIGPTDVPLADYFLGTDLQ